MMRLAFGTDMDLALDSKKRNPSGCDIIVGLSEGLCQLKSFIGYMKIPKS